MVNRDSTLFIPFGHHSKGVKGSEIVAKGDMLEDLMATRFTPASPLITIGAGRSVKIKLWLAISTLFQSLAWFAGSNL